MTTGHVARPRCLSYESEQGTPEFCILIGEKGLLSDLEEAFVGFLPRIFFGFLGSRVYVILARISMIAGIT